LGLIKIVYTNLTASATLKPPEGYKWKVQWIEASVTGTSTAVSSLTVGIPSNNYLVLLDIASTSTNTTVSGQSGFVSGSNSNPNVGFTGENVCDYTTGLDLAVTNNGKVVLYILIEEVPS
jgi:hypothetical protein